MVFFLRPSTAVGKSFVIAAGFILRAVGGAIAVAVSISPWLLICTMLLALLVGFGKRRHERRIVGQAVDGRVVGRRRAHEHARVDHRG